VAVRGGTEKIANDAYQAASGAYQAIVGIPYVGPVLAPIAADVAFAAMTAFEGGIVSAAGGYEVPSDSLAVLHKNEVVLPATLASGFKSLIASGSTPKRRHLPTLNISISAVDSKSAVDLFTDHGRELVAGCGDRSRTSIGRCVCTPSAARELVFRKLLT